MRLLSSHAHAQLLQANDHAKAAVKATHASETTVAVNEHTRAAGEFANAAKDTTSVEALRTLKLLEQHHQRLSEILQIGNQEPHHTSAGPDQADDRDNEKATSILGIRSTSDSRDEQSEKNAQPLPTLHKPPRYPARDLGASIASNLASARGIRSKYRGQPLSPSMTSTEAPGSVENAHKKTESRSRIQDMLEHAEKPSSQDTPGKLTRQSSSGSDTSVAPISSASRGQSPSQDEGFSRFYSAFGTIMNRISAPLAFAGLPLISEDQIEEPVAAAATPPEPAASSRRTRLKPSPSVVAEPDISKIYSKATLRAISRDGQLASDSFYVVPTSGHTTTYANILKFEDKEKRRMEASLHSNVSEHLDDDDFVDARESQAPDSPGGLRRKRASASASGPSLSSAAAALSSRSRNRVDKDMSNIVEELRLENKSLKGMLDKLSKRLHAFESMSQNSGMRLAESMRLMRPGSPGGSSGPTPPRQTANAVTGTSSSSGGVGGTMAVQDEAVLARRNRELEEQLSLAAKRMEQLEKDYGQVRASLGRYRERWEQLKAGAKARRGAAVAAAGAGSIGSGVGGGSVDGNEEGSMSPSLALSRDR
ncbi:E3 ubiquitin-protein ligase BRE1 [Microdochium nivale]|nr:E3 ubiquitin-protein ligase BRE1 [Microdochium nivale]